MGNIFLAGGGLMLVFVNTKTGFKYRWILVLIFVSLFLGTMVYQIQETDKRNFSPVFIGLIK